MTARCKCPPTLLQVWHLYDTDLTCCCLDDRNNNASATGSFVGGGGYALALGPWATISGGLNNRALGFGAFVGGGGAQVGTDGEPSSNGNSATGKFSVVVGGAQNTAFAYASAVQGGFGNSVGSGYVITLGSASFPVPSVTCSDTRALARLCSPLLITIDTVGIPHWAEAVSIPSNQPLCTRRWAAGITTKSPDTLAPCLVDTSAPSTARTLRLAAATSTWPPVGTRALRVDAGTVPPVHRRL